MSVSIICPRCYKTFLNSDSSPGKVFTCPYCATQFSMPPAAAKTDKGFSASTSDGPISFMQAFAEAFRRLHRSDPRSTWLTLGGFCVLLLWLLLYFVSSLQDSKRHANSSVTKPIQSADAESVDLEVPASEPQREFSTNDTSRVIGQWIDVTPGTTLTNRMTIYDRNGRYFLEQKFSDGSSGETELFSRASTGNQRFDTGNQLEEYFIIDADGNLQTWDKNGLIFIAPKSP